MFHARPPPPHRSPLLPFPYLDPSPSRPLTPDLHRGSPLLPLESTRPFRLLPPTRPSSGNRSPSRPPSAFSRKRARARSLESLAGALDTFAVKRRRYDPLPCPPPSPVLPAGLSSPLAVPPLLLLDLPVVTDDGTPRANRDEDEDMRDAFAWPALEELGLLAPEDEAVLPEREGAKEVAGEEQEEEDDGARVLAGALW